MDYQRSDDADVSNGGDLIRVPHSLMVPENDEDIALYGSAPIEDTPVAGTPMMGALAKAAETEPLAVAEFETHWDHRLRPKVRESVAARNQALARLNARNARNEKLNSSILPRIEQLEGVRNAMLLERIARAKDVERLMQDSMLRCAKAHAEAKLAFDPEMPVPKIPDEALLKSIRAHASGEKQPYSESENEHFLGRWTELALSLCTGVIVGLSAGSAAGMVHFNNMARDGAAVIGTAVCFGIAVTILGGQAVKLAWRWTRESYDLGKAWVWQAAIASAVTLALIAIETVVDQRGLMGAAALHQQVAALGGKKPSGDGGNSLVFFLLGAVSSAAYFAHAALRGALKDRSAASNRVAEAQERERLDLVKEYRDNPAWIGVVAAGNELTALGHIASQALETNGVILDVLAARAKDLRAELKPIADRPSPEDTKLMERAAKEAEGQQTESDRRLRALIGGRTYEPPEGRSRRSKKIGMIERIKGLFGKVKAR